MRAIPLIIAAIVILTVPLVYFAVREFAGGDATSDFLNAEGPAVDSGARIEIEALRQQIEALSGRLMQMEDEINQLRSDISMNQASPQSGQVIPERIGPNTILDAYAQVVLIANRRKRNEGIQVATPSFLKDMLGSPRETLSDDCEPMTNPALKDSLVLEDVGPIRVNMLRPAVESLKRVFAKVKAADPDLYARINSSGSLCVRQIRGTIGRASTHAFGLAVDLNIDGQLDNFADGKTQLGLTILADFFHEEGWVWGASFSREDSMHFEVSRQQLEEWRAEGKI